MGPDALDFWLGTWTATWDGGGGTNTITRELADAVVVERFEAAPPEPWSGMSVSVHDPTSDRWRQTWVDSNGSYWHFVGTRTDEGTIFATPDRVDHDQTYKRMVFSDMRTRRVPLAMGVVDRRRRTGSNDGRSTIGARRCSGTRGHRRLRR